MSGKREKWANISIIFLELYHIIYHWINSFFRHDADLQSEFSIQIYELGAYILQEYMSVSPYTWFVGKSRMYLPDSWENSENGSQYGRCIQRDQIRWLSMHTRIGKTKQMFEFWDDTVRNSKVAVHSCPIFKVKWVVYPAGDHIFVHGIAATPTPLLEGLCDYAVANDLKKLTLHHLHLEGPTKWTEPPYKGNHFSTGRTKLNPMSRD